MSASEQARVSSSQSMRTLFTRPDTWVTIGCLILGSSIQSAQAQTRLHPSAAASANNTDRAACPSASNDEAGQRERRAQAEEGSPLPRLIETEPGRDAASEADDEPGRKLGALRLEELFQLPVKRGKPRLPIAPSTLWKRRFPYVRGARPLHCSIERRGKRA